MAKKKKNTRRIKPLFIIFVVIITSITIGILINYIYNPPISGSAILKTSIKKYQKDGYIFYGKGAYPYNINGTTPEYEAWSDSKLILENNINSINGKIVKQSGTNIDSSWEIDYKKKLYKKINIIYKNPADRNKPPYKDKTFEDLTKSPLVVTRAWLDGKFVYKVSAHDGFYVLYFDQNSYQELREISYNKTKNGKQLSFIRDIKAAGLLPRTQENLKIFFTPPPIPQGFKSCEGNINFDSPNWYTDDNCRIPLPNGS